MTNGEHPAILCSIHSVSNVPFPIIASVCKLHIIIDNSSCKSMKEIIHVDDPLTLMVAPLTQW